MHLVYNIQNPMLGQLPTIDYIRGLTEPTKDFLCEPQHNTYALEFIAFKIRNAETDQVLFEIKKPQSQVGKNSGQPNRFVQYHFGPQFFKLNVIGTTLEFANGPKPAKKFLMIERHYFKNKLIKSYQFQVPFCIPNSRNSMEAVYELPQFSPEQQEQMIKCPFETISDSFYFVQGTIIMHTKAAYSYAPFS